ncbi:hypothetical protein L3V59_12805 [Burkholderia aenigmatica]|uniref:hypothetical protein n=1 Tax=Burkholderia aenigmatica TaxID=2015348 RepID=UPI001F17284A|nr:hypothetical protein [Burkholderia aenigmatica]UKD10558.1 hypothetical protein L3V59_12805 [Burkholderia aenigmatica]
MAHAPAALLVLEHGHGTIAVRAGLDAGFELRVDVFEACEQQIAVALQLGRPGIGRIVVLRMTEHGGRCAQRVIRDHLIEIGAREADRSPVSCNMVAGAKHLDPVGEALGLGRSGLVHASQSAGRGSGKNGEPFHKQMVLYGDLGGGRIKTA